jgi:hypothetical protein
MPLSICQVTTWVSSVLLLGKATYLSRGRSFFKTLHEIQGLQAARSGAVVPPPAALDVDLTLHPEPSEETADNACEDEITKRTQLSAKK